MKLTVNGVHSGKPSVTSYRFVMGCRTAKELGFLDSKGNCREVIPYIAKNGVLFIPIEQKHGKLSYNGYSTEICEHDGKYYGAIAELPYHYVWSASSIAEAEASFHKLVNSIAE